MVEDGSGVKISKSERGCGGGGYADWFGMISRDFCYFATLYGSPERASTDEMGYD